MKIGPEFKKIPTAPGTQLEMTNSALCGERDPQQIIFRINFSISNFTMCTTYSCEKQTK